MHMGVIKTALSVLGVAGMLYVAAKAGSCSCMTSCSEMPEPVKRKVEYVSRQYTHTIESAIDTFVEAVEQAKKKPYER